MKRLVFIVLLSAFWINANSQFYPFDSIPGNLKKSAIAVVRSEQCLFTISKPGQATRKIKKAVTLLNEEASAFRFLMVYYDKFSRVNYIKGSVYDEKGKIVKVMGPQDIYDLSAITGGSFYTDDRMKVIYFPVYKFPYTIEYEYEVTYSSLPGYPDWSFQDLENVSVVRSGIQYIVPQNMKLRFFEQALRNKVDSFIIKDNRVYTWQEENLEAWSSKRLMARAGYKEPVLYTAPLDFEFGGFSGSMRSWEEFGSWVYSLNRDRDALPDDEISTVKTLASKFTNRRELVKAIYEYMQSNTRYTSVQIGIGGFRTAEASSVSKNGFGDCKALVNYTQALLKAAGIKSYYTLVKSGVGEKDINTSFVDNQFDHVILCVPMQKDTVWLECTSQSLPFNCLSGFTSDRHVLLITPEGGRLVKTPGFTNEQNSIVNTGSVFINMDGTSSAMMDVEYSGIKYFDASDILSNQSDDEMKRSLYSTLGLPKFTVVATKFSENKTENPTCMLHYQIGIEGFGVTKEDMIYFTPLFSKSDFLPRDTTVMKISYTESLSDSITYFLPVGFKVESLPEPVSANSEFGAYSLTISGSDDRIVLKRRFVLNKGKVPASKYEEFRKFYNTAARSDREVIILRKTK